ncbi:hypothetical protein ACFQ6U_19090 [Streptomyces sp. NPDC056465]|uniref:hypothetical protein n=1 Tax=Streptomyces sp. NPDC056465 TaxID=3345829 RepID=UPI0036AD4183
MTIEDEANVLLTWLRRKVGANCLVSIDPHRTSDWEDHRSSALFTLVAWLAERGLVTHHGQDGPLGCRSVTARCTLTPRGVREADRLIHLRDSKLHQFDAAANGLISIAMDDIPDYHVTIEEFSTSCGAFFLGHWLDYPVIKKAATYLVNKKLATVPGLSAGAPSPDTIDLRHILALTPLGIRCGNQQPINVRNFVTNQDNVHSATYIYGGNNQVGNHNTQNNTIGFSPDQLAQFAQQVLTAAVTMDVPEVVRERITDDAQALRREAEREEPEPGRLRRLFEGLQDSLRQAGQDQAAQKLIEMGGGLLIGMFGG